MLELKNVCIQFGGLKVIENLSFTISKGELVGLIGPNGAGKTTAFNLISGIYRPTRGQILLDGQPIHQESASKLARKGIVRTFQNIRLFPTLSVLENVQVSMHKNCEYGLSATVFRTKSFHDQEAEFKQRALKLLSLFKLDALWDHPAGALPYGIQRKIEVIRALAGNPRLLLLDEPAAGLNHAETGELMMLIKQIRDEFDLAILLIEHDMKLVMGICERILVLDHGEVIAQGLPSQIQKDPKVIEAYLGVEDEDSA